MPQFGENSQSTNAHNPKKGVSKLASTDEIFKKELKIDQLS